MANTHEITKTKVVQLSSGQYVIEFEFDDGYTDNQPVSRFKKA